MATESRITEDFDIKIIDKRIPTFGIIVITADVNTCSQAAGCVT